MVKPSRGCALYCLLGDKPHALLRSEWGGDAQGIVVAWMNVTALQILSLRSGGVTPVPSLLFQLCPIIKVLWITEFKSASDL